MSLTPEQLDNLRYRLQELARQLENRATLFRLEKSPVLADEFERLKRVEVDPMLEILAAEGVLEP